MTLKELANLPNQMGDDWETMINYLATNNGRIVTCGIGKSAFVGQKLAATLNSTGTQAYFLHAADAMHGDLGVVGEGDTLIAISKSGESTEMKAWLPQALRQPKTQLIAIVGNMRSSLADMASWALDASVSKESCPLNLAPTTSTLAQLLVADALAIALMKKKGITSSDFAKRHPGGMLGKETNMLCSQLIGLRPKPSIFPNDNLLAIVDAIGGGLVGAVAVLNDTHRVEGIITDGDLRRAMADMSNLHTIKATDIMNKTPVLISQNTFVKQALGILRQKDINQIVLIDEHDKYAGMIHLHDILKEGFSSF